MKVTGYYSSQELSEFGLKAIGDNVLISRKASIYMPLLITIGHDVRIDDFCFVIGNVTLGNYIHLAPYASIHGTGEGSVTLKDFTAISGYSTIYAGSDDYSGAYLTNPMIDDAYKNGLYSDIVLEKHSIIGLHCVLLPRAYLAEGCALGAMSLLAKKTEPWGIYVGSPAKRLKDRKRDLLELEREFLEKESGQNIY